MSRTITLTCPSGHPVRVPRPQPGESVRCLYCGAETVYLGAAVTRLTEAPPHAKCPHCAGGLEVAFVGPKKEKVLLCRRCEKTVDLSKPAKKRPEPAKPPPPPPEPAPPPAPRPFVFNGREFDTWERVEVAVRRALPPKEAVGALRKLRDTGSFNSNEPPKDFKSRIRRF